MPARGVPRLADGLCVVTRHIGGGYRRVLAVWPGGARAGAARAGA